MTNLAQRPTSDRPTDRFTEAFDALDVARLWTPHRENTRTRVDSLPFHAEHADLLRNTETLAYLIRTYTTWEMTCAGLGHPGRPSSGWVR